MGSDKIQEAQFYALLVDREEN